jgi:DNA-binding LacI/PurR family transcriptional regulator
MYDGMEHRITVYDIADKLHLSPSTVSRALGESALIGQETRRLVQDMANALGYRKRTVRRSESRSSRTVRLFIPASRDAYVHLFYDVAELIDGMQQGFGDARIDFVTSLNDSTQPPRPARKSDGVDAVVFAFNEASDDQCDRYQQRGIPVVHINRIHNDRNYVAIDNYLGMETLLRKVHAVRPAVRPCFIGFSPVAYISRERRAGLLGAASKLNIGFDTGDCFEFDRVTDLDGAFVRRLAGLGYTGVFCFNDLVAVHLHNRALREGLRIPEDFTLTGFDNAPILDLAPKRIDTVEFSIHRLGLHTGAWLRKRLLDRVDEAMRVTLAGDYIPGETIGPEPIATAAVRMPSADEARE